MNKTVIIVKKNSPSAATFRHFPPQTVTQSFQNFDLQNLVNCLTLRIKLWMNHSSHIKNISIVLTFNFTWRAFLGQNVSLTWLFLRFTAHSCNYSTMCHDPWWSWFCSAFSSQDTNLAATLFVPKSFLKFRWT